MVTTVMTHRDETDESPVDYGDDARSRSRSRSVARGHGAEYRDDRDDAPVEARSAAVIFDDRDDAPVEARSAAVIFRFVRDGPGEFGSAAAGDAPGSHNDFPVLATTRLGDDRADFGQAQKISEMQRLIEMVKPLEFFYCQQMGISSRDAGRLFLEGRADHLSAYGVTDRYFLVVDLNKSQVKVRFTTSKSISNRADRFCIARMMSQFIDLKNKAYSPIAHYETAPFDITLTNASIVCCWSFPLVRFSNIDVIEITCPFEHLEPIWFNEAKTKYALIP